MANKAELQKLVKGNSPRIFFNNIPSNSKFNDVYRSIKLDGQILSTFIYCVKCNNVLAKQNGVNSNLHRHYKIHLNDANKIQTSQTITIPSKSEKQDQIIPYRNVGENVENKKIEGDFQKDVKSENNRGFSSNSEWHSFLEALPAWKECMKGQGKVKKENIPKQNKRLVFNRNQKNIIAMDFKIKKLNQRVWRITFEEIIELLTYFKREILKEQREIRKKILMKKFYQIRKIYRKRQKFEEYQIKELYVSLSVQKN